MKKVAVIFADGFEEIEGVSVVDVLRRGGVEVDIVGLDKLPIAGAHGVKFVCDMTLYDLEEDERSAGRLKYRRKSKNERNYKAFR